MVDTTELKTKTLVETDNYSIWQADEPDQETTYHLELNNVTIHFFQEEWEEFLDLIQQISKKNY
jgi:hypothetical protein